MHTKSEMIGLRQFPSELFHEGFTLSRLSQCFFAGLRQIGQAAESLQEFGASDRADADDVIELRRNERLAAQLSMKGDGKAVCLVTNPLQQMSGW